MLGALVVAVAMTFSQIATAQSVEQSDAQHAVTELMRTGIKEYRRHNLEPARQAFEQAWRLERHPSIAASLADVEMKLGRYREAAEYWHYYIDRANTEEASDRADAEAQLLECHKHLGNVHVVMDPPDARLFVDNEAIGPFENDLLLDPGEHALRAEVEGRVSPTARITVAAGQSETVTLAAPPERPTMAPSGGRHASPPPSVSLQNQNGNQGRTIVLVSGGILTAASLGIGIGYAFAARSTNREITVVGQQVERAGDPELARQDASCSPPPETRPAQCDDLFAKTRELDRERNVSVATFAVGGGLAVATLVTYFLWPRHKSEPANSASFAVLPWSLPGARGVQLDARF